MFYGNRKTQKLNTDLPVITICLAKLYVYKMPWANKHSFVSMQYQGLYMKKYVHFIVVGDKYLP
jgi:hypothetical protein